jgi:hypothetical protein
MALNEFILQKGQLFVQQVSMSGAKLENVVTLDNSPFLNGKISKVSDLSDLYSLDEYIIFDAGQATKFSLDGEYYYLIVFKITTFILQISLLPQH